MPENNRVTIYNEIITILLFAAHGTWKTLYSFMQAKQRFKEIMK
jgi:hypothetical protein